MSDSENTTFDYGKTKHDKYEIRLEQGTINKLHPASKKRSKAGVSLVANSAAYAEDDVKYKVLSKARFWDYVTKKKKSAVKMNDSEFKLMLSKYLQDDVFVKKEIADEYLATYYHKIRTQKVWNSQHAEHLKLMYRKVFSKEGAEDDTSRGLEDSVEDEGENKQKTMITEIAPQLQTVNSMNTQDSSTQPLKTVKRYIKTAIILRGEKDRQEMYIDMLKRMGRITMQSKETGNFLESTAKKIKSTHAKIASRLEEAKGESKTMQSKVKGKLRGLWVRSQPGSPKNKPNKFVKKKPVDWINAADLKEATANKEAALVQIREKLAAVTKDIAPMSGTEESKKPRTFRKAASYCVKSPKCSSPSCDKALMSFYPNPAIKKLVQTMDERNVIVRSAKNYDAVPPRIIDYSLYIGSPVSTRKSSIPSPVSTNPPHIVMDSPTAIHSGFKTLCVHSRRSSFGFNRKGSFKKLKHATPPVCNYPDFQLIGKSLKSSNILF